MGTDNTASNPFQSSEPAVTSLLYLPNHYERCFALIVATCIVGISSAIECNQGAVIDGVGGIDSKEQCPSGICAAAFGVHNGVKAYRGGCLPEELSTSDCGGSVLNRKIGKNVYQTASLCCCYEDGCNDFAFAEACINQ